MQSENRFFDDLAKLAAGAVGSMASLRQELEGWMRQQLERLVERMELVTREEFEAVKAMAAAARTEQEALARRLAALEAERGAGAAEPAAPPPAGAEEPPAA